MNQKKMNSEIIKSTCYFYIIGIQKNGNEVKLPRINRFDSSVEAKQRFISDEYEMYRKHMGIVKFRIVEESILQENVGTFNLKGDRV